MNILYLLLSLLVIPLVRSSEPKLIKNPYQYVWENYEGNVAGIIRFSIDLDNDNNPELFLGAKSLMGNGGGNFHVFSRTKNESFINWEQIGIDPGMIQILPNKNHKVHSIKGYNHLSYTDGDINVYDFNGTTFKRTEQKRINRSDLEKNISPQKITTEESGLKLNWKP